MSSPAGSPTTTRHPPTNSTDPAGLLAGDKARFVNELRAFIEVEDGRITAHGHLGGGRIGGTTLRLASAALTFPGAALPDLRPPPQIGDGWVRFEQTAGGRTGVAAPHLVHRRPFVQLAAPTAWTTLSLTIHGDGRSDCQLTGASPFPRHWLYDHTGRLVAKSGLIDFQTWYRQSSGQHTPWGGERSPALVTAVESALERQLSAVMIGSHPRFVRLRPGEDLVAQGAPGGRLFVLFDGVLLVLRDGRKVTEVGPGAVLGELALLDGGRRTATLRAVTPCRVAVVPGDRVAPDRLDQLARQHDQPTT